MNFGFGDPLSPEQYARELCYQMKITSWPINIPIITKKLGIEYVEEDLGVDEFDGALDTRGSVPILVVNTRIAYAGRRNFTAAHELGHFKIKGHEGQSYQCSAYDVMSYNAADKKREWEANRFAAELLMPIGEVEKFTRMKSFNYNTIDQMAENYGVSITAAAIRLVETLSDRCAVVFSRNGQISWSVSSKSFKFDIYSKGKPVSRDAYAFDFFDSVVVKDKFQELGPRGWLASAVIPRGTQLLEHSRYFSELGMVLTLLYIPQQEHDDWDEDY